MTASRDAARRAFGLAALRLLALFALVFYGVDSLSTHRASRWHLYADWELAIPYWPAAYPVYVSVFALPFLVLALVRDPARVREWERAMATALAGAGAVFLAFPAELGWAPADAGAWEPLARLIRVVSGRYNLMPSLHVAFSIVTLGAVVPWADRRLRALLFAWLVLLVGSVLVTHQHHVADVVGGGILGWALGRRFGPLRPEHWPSRRHRACRG